MEFKFSDGYLKFWTSNFGRGALSLNNLIRPSWILLNVYLNLGRPKFKWFLEIYHLQYEVLGKSVSGLERRRKLFGNRSRTKHRLRIKLIIIDLLSTRSSSSSLTVIITT